MLNSNKTMLCSKNRYINVIFPHHCSKARLAQLVEHQTFKPAMVGSNPARVILFATSYSFLVVGSCHISQTIVEFRVKCDF